jgi:hypothetical protein
MCNFWLNGRFKRPKFLTPGALLFDAAEFTSLPDAQIISLVSKLNKNNSIQADFLRWP